MAKGVMEQMSLNAGFEGGDIKSLSLDSRGRLRPFTCRRNQDNSRPMSTVREACCSWLADHVMMTVTLCPRGPKLINPSDHIASPVVLHR